jgi:hypothetical protein
MFSRTKIKISVHKKSGDYS